MLVAGLGLVIKLLFPPGAITWTPTPEFRIIPAPTRTLESGNGETIQTPVMNIPVELDGVAIGVYVQVTGTGGTGLRLRSEPGSAAKTEAVASENEVFLVINGPIVMDGYTWWKLEGTYQSDRVGWAAAEFLAPIITPTPE